MADIGTVFQEPLRRLARRPEPALRTTDPQRHKAFSPPRPGGEDSKLPAPKSA